MLAISNKLSLKLLFTPDNQIHGRVSADKETGNPAPHTSVIYAKCNLAYFSLL